MIVSENPTILSNSNTIFTGIYNLGKYSGHPAIFINGNINEFIFNEILDISYGENRLNINRSRNLIIIYASEALTENSINYINDLLIVKGFHIIIETSIKIDIGYFDNLSIVYIPLNNGFGYEKLRDDFLSRLEAIKFYISSSDDNYNYIPDIGQTIYSIPIYVQPIEESNFVKNLNNMQYSLDLCNKLGYYYCIDMNKILGII